MRNRKKWKGCVWVAVCGMWMSCQANKDAALPKDSMDPTQPATLLNVAYGSEAEQKMDVYLPANRSRTSTPVIALIHGGAWMEGDKSDLNDLIMGMKQFFPSYAIVNMNYQLNTSRTKPFPTQENDIQAAITYLRDKAGVYEISPKVVTLGFSAGAHLALLYAYKRPVSGIQVQAAISFVGPTDLSRLYTDTPSQPVRDLLPIMLGVLPVASPTTYQYHSPITYATTASCPTMLFYGGKDDLVPASQGELLQARLKELQIPSQLVIYPNDGHGFSEANYVDAFTQIKAFLTVHVK